MKKLIIVCEEKFRKYGDFLAQLISLSDDKDEKIVGVKDGTVAAQVWTEKDYTHQSVQMSSEQYLLFIGNSKMIKDKRSHMLKKFSQYGMNYGWLGKQAVLFVDEIVNVENYDSFINFAKENQSDIKGLLEVKSYVKVVSNVSEDSNGKTVNKFIKPVRKIQTSIISASVHGLNEMNRFVNNKKIEEQEYTCLILAFYLNGLNEFLGLREE